MKSLRNNPKVDEVEDGFLDDGRFFVHLKQGWDFGSDPCQVIRTKSFDNTKDALAAVRRAKKV